MNPAPAARHAYIAQQLGELLGPAARSAGLVAMIGIFNLGEAENYRVPDGGLFRERPDAVYVPMAALVVEIVSPEDKSWDKLAFYAEHGVSEVLSVDAQERRVHWLALGSAGDYQSLERSALVKLGPVELAEQIDWPH
jgi:Uma2 family endonuclease